MNYHHGGDDEPEDEMHPSLGGYPEQGQGKGGFAKGASHDDKRLRSKAQHTYQLGFLRALRNHILNVSSQSSISSNMKHRSIYCEAHLANPQSVSKIPDSGRRTRSFTIRAVARGFI